MPKAERLPSGSYRIRFTDPVGRRQSITAPTAADVRAQWRNAIGDMHRGEYVDRRRGRTTLAEWAEDWLAGARNLSPGTRGMYRDALAHIVPALGRIPLGQLDATDIDRYLTAKAASLAPSTVHRHRRTIHRMLAVAVDRGLIARNPCAKVTPPRVPATDMVVLDLDQIDALAAAITPRYRAWVYIAAVGGLRWSECVGLRRRHVDGPRVAVVDQLLKRDGVWQRAETKGRNRRVVTLPAFAADELAAHLDAWSQPGPDGLVFTTGRGNPLYVGGWHTLFRRALDRAGLPPIRVHDLRHTAASLAIAAGADVTAVQHQLGHDSARTTLSIYAHRFPGAGEVVAAKLDDMHAESRRARLRAV